ncbi:MAG: hypothetical protein PHJ00_02670 [Candidatus Omnitrophica bacterium]|nr:hypothetical protein [Candidatus Omnitrophota bacterium]MDD5655198.1 hypothetical protein [Candidatus Omnitrophota bacterium]
MKSILAFTQLNFIKGVREKIFYGLLFLLIFFLGLSLFLSTLSVGENSRVLVSAGLSAIEITGLLLLIFSLTFGFYTDKNARMLEVYLSYFPRYVYTASLFLAYILLALFYLLITGALLILVLILNSAFSWAVLAGIYSIALKLSIIVGLSLLFCALFDSPALALLTTIFLYGASQIAGQTLRISGISGPSLQQGFFKFLYYLLPNMDKLDIKYQVIYQQLPGAGFFIFISFYTLIYCLFLWSLSTLAFSRK